MPSARSRTAVSITWHSSRISLSRPMGETGGLSRAARHHLKRAVALGLTVSGRLARSRAARHHDAAVLMYHGVLEEVRGPAAYGDLFVSARDFARHLDHLKRHYYPMSLADIISCFATHTAFPPRAV